MDTETTRAKAKTRQLGELVAREEALAARLQAALEEGRAEKHAIAQEAARVLAHT